MIITYQIIEILKETIKELYSIELEIDQNNNLVLDSENHIFVDPFEYQSLEYFYVRSQFAGNKYVFIFDKFFPDKVLKRLEKSIWNM